MFCAEAAEEVAPGEGREMLVASVGTQKDIFRLTRELANKNMANFFKNLAEEIENDEHERKVL